MQTDRDLRGGRGRLAARRRRAESLAECHAVAAVIVREQRLHGLVFHHVVGLRDRIG